MSNAMSTDYTDYTDYTDSLALICENQWNLWIYSYFR